MSCDNLGLKHSISFIGLIPCFLIKNNVLVVGAKDLFADVFLVISWSFIESCDMKKNFLTVKSKSQLRQEGFAVCVKEISMGFIEQKINRLGFKAVSRPEMYKTFKDNITY